MNEDARRLRTYLEQDRNAIVGNVGGCADILERVLDRLGELEWIVSVLRKEAQS